jgi:hypothetical protein
MTDRGFVHVIDLWPIESNCGACGTRLVNARHGIPVYEDLVLPNDWQGEWGGNDACLPCYAAQQALAEPVTRRQLVEMRGAA